MKKENKRNNKQINKQINKQTNKQIKKRVLRDNLIRDDRFKLAMEVATKCRIETEPVWSAWGIQKLKMGLYEEAREKFKHCLGMN